MDFNIGDVIKMKKQHPCGANEWEITRVGMDFRLKCRGCGRQVMLPRKQVEKGLGETLEMQKKGLNCLLKCVKIFNRDT